MKRGKVILTSIILFLLSACSPDKVSEADRSRIYVISLDQYWPMLQERALKWHSDAYLHAIDLPIYIDSTERLGYYISAAFLSDSEPETMLFIELSTNGNLTLDSIPITPKAIRFKIMREDWAIDSKDALDRLLTDEDVKFLLQRSDFHCSSLDLERAPQLETKPVVWRILVSDCSGPLDYDRSYYIDAMSGDPLTIPQ